MADAEPLITTAAGLSELVDRLRAARRFAFDTEFVSEETFEPVLCLIQVATRDLLAAVDPLAVADLAPFWDVVFDPGVEVVMHAAGEDLRIARQRTGNVPARVVDVQIAAGLVGLGFPLSLVNLVRQGLGIALAGSETRTDWRRRPLSPAQLDYALDDVRHLLELADALQGQLDALGRSSWAEAEYADFLAAIRDRNDEDRWRRLPGLHQLSRRGLEAARRLAGWRADEARRANRPVRQVLRDDLLVAIAKRLPANRKDLEALRDFNRSHLTPHAHRILAAVEAARAVPADDLPEHPPRHDDGPGLTMVVGLLGAALAQCAAQGQVASGLVGSVGDLKDLVRWHLDGRPEDRRPALVRGWRDEACGRVLLDVLAGRRSLRVADPAADVPVALDPV
ncbi:MAG TPA: HRDC domain-containing protein [Isosphaeraceae bacterium]|jgi:ribonuclease D|nr:HRDC domain-containing protein [Isosphaeraceae bacterium]